jgi:hypothetical protein
VNRFCNLFLVSLAASCTSDYEVVQRVDVAPGEVTACGFTRVDNTSFYQYDCNPVFTTTDEPWAPTVGNMAFNVTSVVGHPFYQMWYVGVKDDESYGDYGLGYAVSSEGTDWDVFSGNPLFEEPVQNAWDGSMMDAVKVVWDPATAQYVMIYQGLHIQRGTWGIGVATSSDGRGWDFLSSNPVIDLLEPNGQVSLGQIAGFSGYVAGYTTPNGPCEAFSFVGSDVANWSTTNNMVLPAGTNGEFDDQGILSIATSELDGEHYMFYAGFGDWVDQGSYRYTSEHFMGMATSSDGYTWAKTGGVIPVNQTNQGDVTSIAAHTVGSRIHLWITDEYDGNAGVGYYLFDPEQAAIDDSGNGDAQ